MALAGYIAYYSDIKADRPHPARRRVLLRKLKRAASRLGRIRSKAELQFSRQ